MLRRLEARGEVRGGRFVERFHGRAVRAAGGRGGAAHQRAPAPTTGRASASSISAVDPLNLAGILTPGEKVPRLPGNRLLFESGVPVAVHSAGEVRFLGELEPGAQWALRNLLIRRHPPRSVAAPDVPQVERQA